jgi:hypothetical protein
MKKPSEQIEDAQHKLHDVILAALAEFSEETGLSVPSARWTVTHAMDASGHTQQVVYHSVCTDLASGAW